MHSTYLPAKKVGLFFLLGTDGDFFHADYFPPREAYAEDTAPELSPYSVLVDLHDADQDTYRHFRVTDSIYMSQKEDRAGFPAGLYRASIVASFIPA